MAGYAYINPLAGLILPSSRALAAVPSASSHYEYTNP